MATGGQYNNQYSDVQASNYPQARSRSSQQYGYQPLPPDQESMAYGQATGNNTHSYHTSFPPQPRPRTKSGQVEGGNMTGGVSYNIPVHHFEQQAPIQNAQDQWTYPGPLNQPFTRAGLDTLSGQDTKLEKNNTQENTYSEELRPETHGFQIGRTDHAPVIENPKSGNDNWRADQTEEAADVLQGQQPKIHTQLLTLAVEPRDMITEHESYHNEISGIEAMKRLKVFGNRCYLTRYSEFQKCYILSVCMSDEDFQTEIYKHFELKVSDEGIQILEHKPFANLVEMLKHYENNRLSSAFPTIGKCITPNAYRERVKEIRERPLQQVHQQLYQEQQVQPQQQAQLHIQQAPIQVQQQARLQQAQIQTQIQEHQVQIQRQQVHLQEMLQQQETQIQGQIQQAQIQTRVQKQEVQLQQQAQQIQELQQRKCIIV